MLISRLANPSLPIQQHIFHLEHNPVCQHMGLTPNINSYHHSCPLITPSDVSTPASLSRPPEGEASRLRASCALRPELEEERCYKHKPYK